MTVAQQRVLDALQVEQAVNGGWPVPVRRIAQLSERSVASTYERLLRLEHGGHVVRGPYPQSGFRMAS